VERAEERSGVGEFREAEDQSSCCILDELQGMSCRGHKDHFQNIVDPKHTSASGLMAQHEKPTINKQEPSLISKNNKPLS